MKVYENVVVVVAFVIDIFGCCVTLLLLLQICMRCSQQLSFAAVMFFIWQSDFAVAVISASAVMGLPNAK